MVDYIFKIKKILKKKSNELNDFFIKKFNP